MKRCILLGLCVAFAFLIAPVQNVNADSICDADNNRLCDTPLFPDCTTANNKAGQCYQRAACCHCEGIKAAKVVLENCSQGVPNPGITHVAVGWEEGGVVRAYVHPGRGRERDEWPAVAVGQVKSPEDAVFVDLDEDGSTDVVSSCEGRTRSVFVHWAPRRAADYLEPGAWHTVPFPVTVGQQLWMYALPLQLDGRHGIDLVLGSKGQTGSVGWLQAPKNSRDVGAWTWRFQVSHLVVG